ncbi:MAG TPA: glucose 1-dehydrogenase [Caulobacteraceae bacterium]|nr:glucose 1-dehydrogenase [Caulobacteraceae bacterium]
MKAVTVRPGEAASISLDDWPEPEAGPGDLLVQALALGVCGTDREIIAAEYGQAPPGATRLVLGHESLGRVLKAPANSQFAEGDLVVGIVRRPDPVPCAACAGGEWDMCRNGRYTERGIKEAHGYGAERFALETGFAVKLDASLGALGVLLEPASILAKAWDHIERIGHRTRTWRAGKVLVTGAGPVGLLAALMSRQRGCEVHVYDHNRAGAKAALVRDLGGAYHDGELAELDDLAPDVVIECTGAAPVIAALATRLGHNGILCLAGISAPGAAVAFDMGGFDRTTVLQNDVIFGAVNANRGHYEAAARSLAQADRAWLQRLITRRVPLANWREAFEDRPDDVKVVLELQAPAP